MGAIIGGATQIVGSMIGGKKRRTEQKQANAEFAAQKEAFQNTTFSNEFANLENTAEDLTVNQQASQFQAQQTDAALAQSMNAAIASGGAAGGAQAIAAAALQSKAGISADLAKQESTNQAMRAQQAASNQMNEAQGADDLQLRNYTKSQQLLNMASGRKNAADAAREKATAGLISGISSVAGGVAKGALGGMFGGDKGGDGVSKVGGALKGIFG
jgi:hypothetical protein